MKRPLFAVTLLLVAVAWMKLAAGGYEIPPGTSSGASRSEERQPLCISGQICQKEASAIWLDSITILNSEEAFLRADGPNQEIPYSEKIICELSEMPAELPMGRRVVISGIFAPFSKASNPGEFDSFLYYRSMGVGGKLREGKLLGMNRSEWPLREAAFRLRQFLKARIYRLLPEDTAQVVCALLLGDKTELDRELKNLYKRNGILHILSISSLHITIIGMSLYRFLRRLKLPIVPAALAGGCILLFYGCMAGFSVSACRAIGMYLLRMLAEILGRTYDMLTALGILAAAMVLHNPYYLQNAGFLLSFSAVLGIGIIQPALAEEEDKVTPRYFGEPGWRLWLRKRAGALKSSMSASFSITLMTLPVQLWFYYEVSACSLFVNLLVLPFMKPLLICGFLCLLPGLGWMGMADRGILSGYELICACIDKFPFRTWNPGRPQLWQVFAYYGILLGSLAFSARRKERTERSLERKNQEDVRRRNMGRKSQETALRRKRAMKAAQFLACCAMAILMGFRSPWGDRVIFLSVGQGDCTLVQTASGETYLIDCGSSSRSGVGEYVLLPCLKYYGIHCLDAVLLTHPDNDHMNGILELLELAEENRITVRQLVMPAIEEERRNGEFGEVLRTAALSAAPEKGVEVRWLGAGEGWEWDGGRFLCLHPAKGYSAESSNAYSLCIYGELGNMSLLLTGDVEAAGEVALTEALRERGIQGVTVLKCAHHGSRNSTSAAFLQQAAPAMAVVSCGRGNRHGHPHEETLQRTEEAGARIFRTDRCGAVTVRTDGKRMFLETFLE